MGVSRARPDPVSVVLHKEGWAIPDGRGVQVHVIFPEGQSYWLAGDGKGKNIQLLIGADRFKSWLHDLTASSIMRVEFEGSEAPWLFDLAGTTAVVTAMGECIRSHQIAGVPAPFDMAVASATQPFGAGPAESQPFAAAPPTPAQPEVQGLGERPLVAPLPELAQRHPDPYLPDRGADIPRPPLPVPQPPMPRPPVVEAAPPSPPPVVDARPMPERVLIAATQAAQRVYASGNNDMVRGSARPLRARAICSGFAGISPMVAEDWRGKVTALTTTSTGFGVLAVEIANDVSVQTWNNGLSDAGFDTLISPASPLFIAAEQLQIGQSVRFSGRFVPDNTDCIKETSLTMTGSISSPEFLLRFTDIRPDR